ncbi:MAG: hypothetical protein P0S93_01300 [Candidatus Neptunochlamydia sp.]|nr:hypothetical protein [Candidatus Neptunochlamydia sp.]
MKSQKQEAKTLGQILLSPLDYGSDAAKSDFNGKVRYIRISDIDDEGRLRNNGVVSPSKIEENLFLQKGDLLLARSGSVGCSYIHNEDYGAFQF